ncbi:MAG: SRPBCC family protein [Crocinitomicaceae bacterium]|nr:SRPBCC family protein [Crocinitomicaceae bacterium]MBK8926260.1 SRPBCC family protein [Crocinitomicaceae bacterium]
MPFYQFTRTQKIPANVKQVWDFISRPENLSKITPTSMEFKMTSEQVAETMYAGMIITYSVKPLAGLSMQWMTEITQVKPEYYFVDEQRVGPYKLWHHQHKIEPTEGGVLMTDIITYMPPLGFFGAIANSLFIRKKLHQIFDFRMKALEEIFV